VVAGEGRREGASVSPEDRYQQLTREWLGQMCRVAATKEQFYEGLRAALAELEVEIQACKETM
jgi:hypothetical protein